MESRPVNRKRHFLVTTCTAELLMGPDMHCCLGCLHGAGSKQPFGPHDQLKFTPKDKIFGRCIDIRGAGARLDFGGNHSLLAALTALSHWVLDSSSGGQPHLRGMLAAATLLLEKNEARTRVP